MAGESYPLIAQANYRFTSGQCDMENHDVQINLHYGETGLDFLHYEIIYGQDLRNLSQNDTVLKLVQE